LAALEKMKIKITLLVGFLFVVQAGFSQGFVNLDFESAQIKPIAGSPFYPYGVATTNALPGWTATAYANTTPLTSIAYNFFLLLGNESEINLMATNGLQISGGFSALLQGGVGPGVSISQTGLVPVSTLSLLFAAQSGNGTLQVSLGGLNLPFFALSTGANYTLYGADVSAFAGQTQQLMFSALNVSSGLNAWNIDNIQFSSTAVPEPSGLALAALGTLLLGFRRWKK
jgi:hypothetical protein